MSRKIRASRAAFARRGWMAAGVVAVAGAAALAQPGNTGPDPLTRTIVNMDDIGLGANVYQTATITPGGFVWFRIRLTATIDPARNWLELDMSGPTTLVNPHLAVYDARANLVFVDNDSGGSCGDGNNGTAPALSIGGGSGLLLSRTFGPAWDGGRISTGSHGSSLGAGTYWAVVTASTGTFPDPNPNWSASSNSLQGGTVGLRVTTGMVPATTWNEAQNSVDAGAQLDTAQAVTGSGPLTNILCTYLPASRDMFRIRVSNGATFQAVARVSQDFGGREQVRLFLFDQAGRGVSAINNIAVNTDTTLVRPSGTPPLPAGEYYLAISSNCGGYTNAGTDYGPAVPFTSADEPMWSFQTSNQSIPPTAAGASGTLAYWGRQANCQNSAGYYANLALTGAEFLGTCVADVDDGSGTNTPDGGVTIEDLLYFLQRFEAGC